MAGRTVSGAFGFFVGGCFRLRKLILSSMMIIDVMGP